MPFASDAIDASSSAVRVHAKGSNLLLGHGRKTCNRRVNPVSTFGQSTAPDHSVWWGPGCTGHLSRLQELRVPVFRRVHEHAVRRTCRFPSRVPTQGGVLN